MAVMIVPTGPQDAVRLAKRLLAAAGDADHDDVETVWDERAGVAFVVPDAVATLVFGWQPCPREPAVVESPAAGGTVPGQVSASGEDTSVSADVESPAGMPAAGQGAPRATAGRRVAGGRRPRFSSS
jgi:hypothetical protein